MVCLLEHRTFGTARRALETGEKKQLCRQTLES